MKVKIDRELCIGCGICASICPEIFDMDDENIAVVKTELVPIDLEPKVREAAESCAVEAIIIDE